MEPELVLKYKEKYILPIIRKSSSYICFSSAFFGPGFCSSFKLYTLDSPRISLNLFNNLAPIFPPDLGFTNAIKVVLVIICWKCFFCFALFPVYLVKKCTIYIYNSYNVMAKQVCKQNEILTLTDITPNRLVGNLNFLELYLQQAPPPPVTWICFAS